MSETPQSDVERMLAESVDGFTRQFEAKHRVRDWRGRVPGFDRQLWQEMADLGWTGLLVPEALGGAGLGLREMAVVARRLGAELMPEPLTACAVLSVRALMLGGNGAELLTATASGKALVALAFQEQAGDLDAMLSPTTSLRESAGELTLNGTKRFVDAAAGADGYLVSAAGETGLALLWVPADTDGLTTTLHELADGRYCATLVLEEVTVPVASRVAGPDTAPAALSRAVDEATAINCAELLGIMEAALAMTLEYLRTRVQFGQPIGSFQALQHRAVDLYVQSQLASASLDDALSALEARPESPQTWATVSRAKARAADAAALITRQAIQMHGAIGFTEDSDVGLFVKRAHTLGTWLGNSAHHRRRYARHAPSEEE